MFEILSTCKGGGYMYCKTNPPHPKRNSNNLYPLHRVLMENKLGRLLDYDEVVHHIDENKDNNSIENLALMTRDEHARHHKDTVDDVICVCDFCGKTFSERPNFFRLRRKRNKSGKMFCSRSCGSKYQFSGKAGNGSRMVS